MPLTELVCPHCESIVEVQVTSVTRSRECPRCKRVIVLQFATRVTGSKRKALLTHTKEVVKAPVEAGNPMTQPILLGEDAQKRLMHDPEVRSSAAILRTGILVVSALVVVLLAGHFFKWWPWLNGGGDDVTTVPASARTTLGGGGSQTRTTKEGMVELTGHPQMDEALMRAKEFLEAKNVEERLKLVRDRGLMEDKIRAYYASHQDGPIAYEVVHPDGGAAGGPTFVFRVTLPTGEDRQMMMTTPPGGKPVVDWSSFVIYSDLPWDEWMKEKPSSPRVFRVLAVRDNYFAANFTDESTLRCVKLFDPLSKDSPPVFAYYERASAVGREMEFVMSQSGGQALPLTLALRYPGYGDADNQVLIEERIAEGWVARGR
jgi:hypothetical protein